MTNSIALVTASASLTQNPCPILRAPNPRRIQDRNPVIPAGPPVAHDPVPLSECHYPVKESTMSKMKVKARCPLKGRPETEDPAPTPLGRMMIVFR